MNWHLKCVLSIVAAATVLLGWQIGSPGQQPGPAARPAAESQFEFEVGQSFDAKYQGDSPGHVGRGAGLESRPNAALGDPVYRGQEQIGTVTALGYSRPHGTLEVEFAPKGNVRISVGDVVWIAL
jgi:hypothetical protein